MPNPPPVSDRARSDAISMANMPQLPVQAHIPTSADQTGSPPSGNSSESPSSAQVGNTNPRPARYRLTSKLQAAIHRERSRPASSHISTDGSVVPVTTNPFIPDNNYPLASPPDSNPQLFRDVPVDHSRHGEAGGSKLSETDNLYENTSALVAPPNQSDDTMSCGVQRVHAADSLGSSTVFKFQDESDAPADTEETANEDILASLNRGMDRTFQKIRGLALQHIRNGALDRALHKDVMRVVTQQVFGTISQSDSVHDRPSSGTLPRTESTQVVGGAEAPSISVNLSAEVERGPSSGWIGNELKRASDKLHQVLGSLPPPAQESSVVTPWLEEGKQSKGQSTGVKIEST
ncbi:hypothetical protein E8E11_009078 [Didymella keratinophila]|nr:hypothetical protein E8E11_009078 [Didymella keratinophila]